MVDRTSRHPGVKVCHILGPPYHHSNSDGVLGILVRGRVLAIQGVSGLWWQCRGAGSVRVYLPAGLDTSGRYLCLHEESSGHANR